MKNILKKIFEFYFSTIKPNKKTVLILESSFPAGSNTKIIYDNKESLEKKGYIVDTMEYDKVRVKNGGLKAYIKHVQVMKKVSRYEYVLATHSFQKLNKNQIYINFWHGIPLKAMKKMELDEKEVNRPIGNEDYLITNSKFESTLMSASLHIPYIRQKVIGSPRLDYFNKENVDLRDLKFIKEYSHVIFYIPTFRTGYFDREEGIFTGNLFNLPEVNIEELINFLEEHNILVINKYHPREQKKLSNFQSKNIYNLTDEVLLKNKLDLYEIINQSDILISDYSSVILDYLLLDKPIIYSIHDLEQYRNDRGFLLEPYETWTAGPIVKDQNELQEQILKSINDSNYFSKERMILKKVFHSNEDLDNVQKFFDKLIQGEFKQ